MTPRRHTERDLSHSIPSSPAPEATHPSSPAASPEPKN